MKKNQVITTAILSACTAHTPATFAIEFIPEVFYAGFAVGSIEADTTELNNKADVQGLSTRIDPGSVVSSVVSASADEKHAAWKMFGGYRLNEYFAVEYLLVNLGDIGEKIAATGFDSQGAAVNLTAKSTVEQKGIGLPLVGIYPLTERISIFGKGGPFLWKTKTIVRSELSTNDENIFDIDRHKGAGLTLGIGASYAFSSTIAIRGEWERYTGLESSSGHWDVDMWSVSFVFSFK